MAKDIFEMKGKRAALVEEARAFLDAAPPEGLSAEDEQKYDCIMSDVDRMADEIKREEKVQALEAEMKKTPGPSAPPDPNASKKPSSMYATEEYRAAFNNFLRTGNTSLPEIQAALQSDSDTAGGFIVAPEQFVAQLIMGLDDQVFIRGLATVISNSNAASLGIPAMDGDVDDGDWTSEIATGNLDDGLTFKKRELKPYPLAKQAKVSNKLLRASAIDVESLVRDRLTYKFAVTQEKAFLTGDGVEKPLGVFTSNAAGISTARDVSTGNTATNIGADGLIDAKYALKAQYHKNANWIFHRDAVKMVRKLKDGNGDYLWKAGLSDEPDTILEIPYFMSEFAPNTFTTGQYAGIIGNFKFYWIADALNMQIQRLVELYAATNQTGFIGRLECDGMPVLEEAFARVKLA